VSCCLVVIPLAFAIISFASSMVYVSFFLFLLLLSNLFYIASHSSFTSSYIPLLPSSVASMSSRERLGWHLVAAGLLLLVYRLVAKVIEIVAQFLIDLVQMAYCIRLTWILTIESLGLFLIYGSLKINWRWVDHSR
jgi:hypothetical protein